MTDFFQTTIKKAKFSILLPLLFAALLFQHSTAIAQTIAVGSGSYTTKLPSGEIGPQDFTETNVNPKISSGFNQPIQSNDFWSSLIYPFFASPFSNILYAHPMNMKAVAGGLEIGYTTSHIFAANDFLYPYSNQLTVGVDGLTAAKTNTHHYGDWTVTALWESGNKSMEATLGHGLPYVFFKINGGDAVIKTKSTPTVWFNQNEVLGVTIEGKHYGIFAPTGSGWSGTTTLRSSLNGKNYLSVALLPDANPATLELFRKHAYAFVTNSIVEWDFDESTSELITTYKYETTLMDSNSSNINETMTALYRHQWLNVDQPLTSFNYKSPRGEMKLYEGSEFTTTLKFNGILPALPDNGDYNKQDLLGFIQDAAAENLPVGPTYENGKLMARFSNLIYIADQIGAITERDHFISELKNRLEDWFTAGGEQEYYYNDKWDVLTGYPSGYGADNQINDHHFHASYAVMSAATIARYDSTWASQSNWGGMVNLLIKDANNWDRSDERFPFLRTHDSYAGHSWAAGHGDFAEGNNQESSSESMNFASAVILWGEATDQKEIRDLGVFLHATETTAVEQYWFDIDNAVFPADYPHVAIGMVWGGKGVHSTWFGAEPEFIHGINILPITSGSLYLGRNPEYVIKNYNEIVNERNGQPKVWQDILWEYLALADPNLAISHYYANIDYEPFDGESRAHTLHWLYNLKKMGQFETTIFADITTYAVFRDAEDNLTYVAYNASSTERKVTFSDGFEMLVPGKELLSKSTSTENPDAPVALLLSNKTSGKSPLSVEFSASKSFDRNNSPLTFLWDFDDGHQSTSADTNYVFTEVGSYNVVLSVKNALSFESKDSVTITVLGNGTPFSGTPVVIPAKIEAEHYDKGGEGVAYHDTEANNIGLAFRPDEGVDLEGANDQTFDVYWIVAGEWIEYTFQVNETGDYKFTPYVATIPGMGGFNLFIDNVDVSGFKKVNSTGGWQFWKPIDIPPVTLEPGVHIMRFEFDSETDKNGWLFSLNYIDVAKVTQVGAENNNLPNEFKLSQNYPNPFNPVTTINYAIPVRSMVILDVYDMLGQKISQLVNEVKEIGNYQVKFDALDLPSGIYLYKLRVNDFVEIKKMILIK
ncbi:MAG: carbohydrate-binding protein [Melioribacteraceae bacterium]|nr:carbohydrate-binding protein [Melioribacteraceae bacterium]MCF8265578.1 carbohydrate-binding protein [Melioribacteraceae bacterium]